MNVLALLLLCFMDSQLSFACKGRNGFVNEGTKSHLEIIRDGVHGVGQQCCKVDQLFFVILHGSGQVHDVVQIHRIVLHSSEPYRNMNWLIWYRLKTF